MCPQIFCLLPQIFFCPPSPSQSRYSGAGLASPIPPFLPKPSSNSPMLEKSKVQKQSKKGKAKTKTDFTRFSNLVATS